MTDHSIDAKAPPYILKDKTEPLGGYPCVWWAFLPDTDDRIECYECGKTFLSHCKSIAACPDCGWTDAQQQELEGHHA